MENNCITGFLGKPEGRRRLGKFRDSWRIILKRILIRV
jgi:hypothetical protein